MGQSRDLSTSALRTFVTIVEQGGFTPAADVLGLTQPSVSQQIKKLEEQVAQPLLIRGAGKLKLTEEGQTLLEYARRILVLNDEAFYSLYQPNIKGKLKLGIPHEFTFSVMPKLVGAFSQIHPDVVIEVECELSKNLLGNLKKYDVVIALHKSDTLPQGIRIRQEPLVWVSSLDYRFDYNAPLKIVAAPPPCIYREAMQSCLRSFQPGWSLLLTSTSYGAVCAAVSTGMGVTVLAQSVVPEDLRIVESKELTLEQDVDLQLHYDVTAGDAATMHFVEFIQKNLADPEKVSGTSFAVGR